MEKDYLKNAQHLLTTAIKQEITYHSAMTRQSEFAAGETNGNNSQLARYFECFDHIFGIARS
jgi:hypothetical protein